MEARWLVEEASGAGNDEELGVLVTERGMAHHDSMVARRLAGEPLQYVLGRWGFRTLDLMVDRRVLIPRPETEVVAGIALQEADRIAAARGGATVLVADLGTGSGAIGLSIAAECPEALVWCTDSSSDALAVARANCTGLGRPAGRVTILEGSWFDALPSEMVGTFDVLVSNPPYVDVADELPAEVADWEPSEALLSPDSGCADLESLVDGAMRWLAPGGVLVLEMAPDQTVAMADRAWSAGFVEVCIHPDLTGRERSIVARVPA
jgi:release factor glutamine methyltransferase